MFARALLLRTKLLIADEPVSMFDASLRAIVLGSLRTPNTDLGIPILYITHDLTAAFHVATAIIVLYRGTIVEAGDEEAVIQNPQDPYTRLLIDLISTRHGAMAGPSPTVSPGQRRHLPAAAPSSPAARTPCHAVPPSFHRFTRPAHPSRCAAFCTKTRRAPWKRD